MADSERPFDPMLEVRVERLGRADASLPEDPEVTAALSRVEAGFSGLALPRAFVDTALGNIRNWIVRPTFEPYGPQLQWLIEKERWALLLDSFYRVLPFGTGGRRGAVGIGTNRFNPITLASSVQGHVDFLKSTYPDQDLSVVIVYDVRVFRDLRGHYAEALPNPLCDMSSRDFARIAAEVYAANAIDVYTLPDTASSFVSTPELSFAIRALGATAGLNISASHNHPDDNGGKFYNRHGGQEVPPDDERMADHVERVEFLRSLDYARAREAGLIRWIPPEVHRRYVDLNRAQSLEPDARGARTVFTPLHGTGDSTVGSVLDADGFEVARVPEQTAPDGSFPAVPYRAPNPEVPESMRMGEALARQTGADLVLACDPDADRIGVSARDSRGDYRFLGGNEIAAVLAHYKLERLAQLGRLPERPLVIKTEVTTELLRPITDAFAGSLIGDLLVGFKYHGNVLEQLERTGRYGGLEATLGDFVIAVEESHGILVTHEVRDKDAAGAAILLAGLCSSLKREGRTLTEYLDAIYARFGYYANRLCSMVMAGAEGLDSIQRIQASLRETPPTEIGGHAVVMSADHWDEAGRYGPIVSETDRASRNVLSYQLEGGARVIIRPSGTEPKNKIYIEVPSAPLGTGASPEALARQKDESDARALAIADDFTNQMLAIIGVRLPAHALRVSGLVELGNRIDFAERFLPELEAQVEKQLDRALSSEELGSWIDARLASYGKDARGLVADAMATYLAQERRALAIGSADAGRRAQLLDAIERCGFEIA